MPGRAFAKARAENRKALVIYLTASDPDFETSLRVIVAAARAGADVIELGVPWSDPSADGPAIQLAMRRALGAGGGMKATLELCRRFRREVPDVPVVLFGYANPIFVRGPQPFAAAAKEAGADAVLCVDWPPEEASELTSALRAQAMDFIPLIAPTSTPARIRAIGAEASGFLYYVSMTGITGRTLADLDGPKKQVAEIRTLTGNRLPIVVGFGIATPEQAKAIASFADGVVDWLGRRSHRRASGGGGSNPAPEMEKFVAALRAALQSK